MGVVMLEKPSVKVIVLGLLVTIVASVPGLCQDNSTTVGPTMPMPDGNSTATVDCGSGVICYNGGRCNSTFNCICATGYQGYDCSRQSCEDRCLNGGTCDGLGNCLCVFGFAGEYCRSTLEVCGTTPNRTICYNNGSCVNGSCVCTDGFGGTSCSDYICDNPCLNGGSCYLNDCSCPDGFSGRTCEQTPGPECGDSYCYNNGSCGANDTCTCIGSYLPPYCRLRGCDQPCQNNASCYDGSCSCPSGYSGMYCETTLTVCGNFSEIFCYNNGTCQNNTCVCVGSYTGSDCSTVVAGNSTTSSPNSTVAPSNGTTVSCGSGVFCYNGGSCNGTFNCNCTTGYQGYDCSRQSCEGRCMNNGTCSDGYCSCAFGYTGMWCETALEVCGTAPNRTICYNNGSCVGDSCVCTDGFTGGNCTDYICDPLCENEAYCGFDNACFCVEGFTGSRCEEAPGPDCGDSYCYNNGSCGANDTCTCIGSYMPPYCRQRGCNSSCLNNGSCYDGSCSCAAGYTGQYCETPYNPGSNMTTSPPTNTTVTPSNGTSVYCSSDLSCYNGGSCNGTFNCNCTTGYQGRNCSIVTCGGLCRNGGSCSAGICVCQPGYRGQYCQEDVVSACPGGCGGYGQCVNETCVCEPQSTGYNCQERLCDPPCQNGSCGNGQCSCYNGFSGDLCEIAPGPPCDGGYCWNNGICSSDGQCVCTSSFTGRYCRTEMCPFDCLNNGSCSDRRCICPNGFNGTRCEIPPGPVCGSTYCWNNGTCSSDDVCLCRDPYVGADCTDRRCGFECLNNGSCSYERCNCPLGFTGERCETEGTRCSDSNLCYNGTCDDESNCVCLPGFRNNECSERDCDAPCVNGYCASRQCLCNRGFGGEQCTIVETPSCGGGLCYNGTCMNDTCVCRPGYRGRECYQRDCVPECENGGGCYDGNCTCRAPYTGDRCEQERELCGDDTVCVGGDCDEDRCVCTGQYYGTSCDRSCRCRNNGTCDMTGNCTCLGRFTGRFCEVELLECEGLCRNGGSCSAGRCVCQPGYSGQYCQEDVSACPGGCGGYGQCVNETCVCEPRFTGYNCQERLCDPPCQNGSCGNGQCSCYNGFSGDLCEIAPGPPCDEGYCWNNGICRSDDQCVCTSSFTGRYCRTEMCPFDCLNNGSCGNQRCQCRYGFNGTRCEIPPGPVCGSTYCWNNGTCSSDDVCQCRDPYVGADCTDRRCESECRNNGSCSFGRCSCQFGFTGEQCETEVASCSENSLCYNGTCNDENRSCVCFPGFKGYECSERECDGPCVNGYCTSGPCICDRGFAGEQCTTVVTPRCGGDLCYNGTCVNDTCVCRSGYRGRECYQRDCVPECENGGGCYNGNCTCRPPYTGDRCEQERELCGDDTVCVGGDCDEDRCVCIGQYYGTSCDRTCRCRNSGTCDVLGNCTCPRRFTGRFCEIELLCTGVACLNGGSCNTSTGACICTEDYTGPNCASAVPVGCDNLVCANGGTASCVEGRRSCQCPKEYTGTRCETFRFPPCLSDAEMIRSDRYNVTLSFPWPATSYGILYTLSCPCAANPSLTRGIFATRSCGEQGRWRETDYSVCLSATFVRFCVGSAEISTDAINDILSTSRQNLTGGDVALVTESIGSLATTLNLTDPNARDMLLGVLESVLSLDSEVLANTSRSTQASTTIVESFESIGDDIVLPSTGRFSRSGAAYSLTVAAVPPGGPPEEGFGVNFDNGGSESCLLPPSIVPAGTRITASVIRIVALFRGSDPTSVVASNIVSVVVQGRVLTGLAVKIIFNLPKTSETPEGMVDMCQYWNVSANGGIGDWSTDGCEVMGTVGSTVRCACDHLTSFAVVQVPQSTSDPSTPAAATNVAAIVVPILVVLIVLIAGAAIIAGVVVFFIRQRGSKGYDVAVDNTVMENTEVSTPLSSPWEDKNDQDSQSEPKEPRYVPDEDMKAMEANTATSNV